MSNPSKRKGTEAETAVVEYLRAKGFRYAERRTLSGSSDKGDINVDPSVVIEVKAEKTMTLAAYIDETEREAKNAGASLAVCWAKRRGKGSPGEWYVVMTGERFVELLRHHCGMEIPGPMMLYEIEEHPFNTCAVVKIYSKRDNERTHEVIVSISEHGSDVYVWVDGERR